MQVLDRQREILGEGAVPAGDAEDGATLAMGAAARGAPTARAAHGVDLADDPPAAERCTRARDDADKPVSRDARERVIAPGELDVGVTDPGLQHPDECLTRGRVGPRDVVPEVKVTVFEPQGAHDAINMEEP